jgi:hypothetical protein
MAEVDGNCKPCLGSGYMRLVEFFSSDSEIVVWRLGRRDRGSGCFMHR